MAITITQIETVLVANGFTAQPDTNKKYRELVHHDTRESVYLNKAAPGVYSQLLVHPRHLEARARLIEASTGIGSSREKRFGSNLRKFPKALNNGEKPCSYGVPFGFDTVASLELFLKDRFG